LEVITSSSVPPAAYGEIEVTEEMVRAGLDELWQHNFGSDMGYVLESVYRAMAYEAAAKPSPLT